MRELFYPKGKSHRQWGQIHGETYREEIQMLAYLRVYLARTIGGFANDEAVLSVAGEHIAPLKAFSGDLHGELLGIAEGANISAEKVVVLNHYTDLRDLGPAVTAQDGGCTVLYAKTKNGPVLAQTWDMHASAIPYVMLLHTPGVEGAPGASLLSLTGCLGMAGLNDHGVGVAINNLASNDARVGVVWSALVRKALLARTSKEARPVFAKENIGSGHHYLVADAQDVFALETSGTESEEVYSGTEKVFCHTNHCLNKRVGEKSRVSPVSTTYSRLTAIEKSTSDRPVESAMDAYERMGSQEGFPGSICTNQTTPETPHAPATCGAISLDLKKREMLCVAGFPHNVAPKKIVIGANR